MEVECLLQHGFKSNSAVERASLGNEDDHGNKVADFHVHFCAGID